MSYYIRIVILNYNESKYTIELIRSLKNQVFKNFEIIVVDNNSSYEEKKILRDNLSEDIYVIYSEDNKGYSGGNNLGLRYQGQKKIDYHLVLNNDIIVEDSKFIITLLEGMLYGKSKNVAASSPLIDTVSLRIPIERQIQVRRLLSKWDTFVVNIPLFNLFTKKLKYYFLYEKEKPYLEKQMLCDTINGAAFMIENEFLKNNNYLDEGTFLYYEEIILGKQIKEKGMTCMLNGNTSIKHLQGLSTKSCKKNINVNMERFKYKSSLYYLKKYENLGFICSLTYVILSELSILLKKIIALIK